MRYTSLLAVLAICTPLHALSATEVPTQRIQVPSIDPSTPLKENDGGGLSVPGAMTNPYGAAQPSSTPANADGPLPEIHYGTKDLPAPVAAMRQKIIDAALTGNPEALRPVMALSKTPPRLATQESDDKIDTLRAESGDEDGLEILAILADVLDAGWVVEDKGTPKETYVWPYFADIPPSRLTPKQMVEVYRVMTAGDFAEIAATGSYLFYKVEIGADGTWKDFSMPELPEDQPLPE